MTIGWLLGSIGFLLLTVVGLLWFMFLLQKRYLQACLDENTMALFHQSPAGLPLGTVRALLALIIVIVSIFLIFLSMTNKAVVAFPEAMVTILGTVLGFYFGSRSPKSDTEGLQVQVQQMSEQQKQTELEKDTNEVQDFVKKVTKNIAMIKKVLILLPEAERKKYEGLLNKLETGLDTVNTLSESGAAAKAVEKAKDLYESFKKENPVKEILASAKETFGKVLGGTVPQIALITAVVALTAKLSGVAYQKWKARVLNAPISPAVFPLVIKDSNSLFSLLYDKKCAVFRVAFKDKAQDNPFLIQACTDFTKMESTDELWDKYKSLGSFESQEVFEKGLAEFRQVVVERDLGETGNLNLQGQPLNFQQTVDAIDKIHQSNDAAAIGDLQKLVTVVEGLQSQDEPVMSIFEKAKLEVGE